jgi:hypothetical protein
MLASYLPRRAPGARGLLWAERGVTDSLDHLVHDLAAVAANPAAAELALGTAAQALRNASAAEVEDALADWHAAIGTVAGAAGGSPQDLVLRALGLPPLPAIADGVPEAILGADAKLLGGWQPGASLGPLVVRASHSAVTTAITAAGDEGKVVLVGLLKASGVTGAIDLGPGKLTGGLVVDDDHKGATGNLGFNAGAISAGALGRLATGDQGVSFVAILGARFMPGIQVGFGFEVSGIGGVVGVNVGVDADELRRRLADGTAVALFFPADTSAAAQLLPAVRDVFKPRAGSVVAGPSFELTWLQVAGASMLRLSLVLLLELPRARLLILGRGIVEVPPMVSLRLDAFGEIDVPRGYYAADLAIVDGRIMGIFRAAGTAALRISSGSPAYTLFTLGGFYPGYRPEVPGIPAQQRLSFGPDLPLPISFRFEGYLAFTGGTFQAGALFEIGFDVGIISASGYLSFDAIAQLDPFHIHAELAGGIDVEALGVDFAGVDFHGSLDAPGPVVVAGRVRVSFLGMKASWSDRFVLGDEDGPPQPPMIDDLAAEIAATVNHNSVSGTGGQDPHVRLSAPTRDAAGRAVVHPMGSVRWSQDVVPLEIPLQRARGRRLAGPRRLTVANLGAGTTAGVTASFAPATFRDADKDTLLMLPAYEQLPSGVAVPLVLEQDAATVVAKDVAYDEVYKGDPKQPSVVVLVPTGMAVLLAGAQGQTSVNLAAPTLGVVAETWSVRDGDQPGAAGQVVSRTAAVIDASGRRTAGADTTALPTTEVYYSTAGLWAAP